MPVGTGAAMKRFRNILVIPERLDADDPAIRRAGDLAAANGARLTIVALLEATETPEYLIPLQTETIDSLSRRLDAAGQPARERGLGVSTRVLIGRPFLEIIRAVMICRYDLVVKTARGRGPASPGLFGSTALHLLRKCPCPVWILDPRPDPGRRGILAAVDPDGTDAEEHAVNRKILELASSLANLEVAPLHIVHAWQVPFEDMIRRSSFLRVSETEASSYIQGIEVRHRERLDALVEPFRRTCPGLTVHFVKGLPESVITDVAKRHRIEVVVMASMTRTGIPGLLIGNTAESVLGHLDRSILTVKPDAFVSPVAA
jgi:universal stress protein E